MIVHTEYPTSPAPAQLQTMTIGAGKSVHVAYYVSGRLCGSLCDTGVYCKGSRMRLSDAPATCPRCAKATHRLSGAVAR